MPYAYVNNIELPSYLSIEIKRDDYTVRVFVHSKIHVDKIKQMPHTYSLEFTNEEILNDADLYKAICSMYGLKAVTRLE